MQRALSFCHRSRSRLAETLFRHRQFQILQRFQTLQILRGYRQPSVQQPGCILTAVLIDFSAGLSDDPVDLFLQLPGILPAGALCIISSA